MNKYGTCNTPTDIIIKETGDVMNELRVAAICSDYDNHIESNMQR